MRQLQDRCALVTAQQQCTSASMSERLAAATRDAAVAQRTSSCAPCSMILPLNTTAMLSASRTVLSLQADRLTRGNISAACGGAGGGVLGGSSERHGQQLAARVLPHQRRSTKERCTSSAPVRHHQNSASQHQLLQSILRDENEWQHRHADWQH